MDCFPSFIYVPSTSMITTMSSDQSQVIQENKDSTAEVPSTAEAPRTDEQDSLLSQNTSQKASDTTLVTSPVRFIYRVISSTMPHNQKKWQQSGSFREKSLQELLTELPVKGNLSSLTFKLFGPKIELEEMINNGGELEFEAMKLNFKRHGFCYKSSR